MTDFYTNINLLKNELQNARIQNLPTAPDNPVEGQLYYNTELHKVYGYNGTAWIDLTNTTEGTITAVTGTAPIVSSGGTAPTISVTVGTTTSTVAAGNDSRFPTTDEKAALSGTGTPSASNKFVTNDDGRLSDDRNPTSHNHSAAEITSDSFHVDRIPNLDADKITSGTFDIARIPAAALERLVVVDDQAARYNLTTASVQTGDTVKQADTGIMYRVVDDTKLSQAAGYVEYSAGSAASVPWTGVSGKPETFAPSSHTHGSIKNDGKIGTVENLPLITGTDGAVTTGAFGTSTNTFCEGNDGRLSDSRTPKTHTHGSISNDGKIGSASNIPIITGADGVLQAGSFGTAANTFCVGNDGRLSDARTPTTHTHGNLTNDGKVGTSANIPIITGTGGVVQAGAFGTGSTNFCVGNDSRLSDAREPIRYATAIGNNANTSFVVTHNKGTRDVVVMVRENNSPYAQVYCDVEMTSDTTITVSFASPPTTNQFRVIVI